MSCLCSLLRFVRMLMMVTSSTPTKTQDRELEKISCHCLCSRMFPNTPNTAHVEQSSAALTSWCLSCPGPGVKATIRCGPLDTPKSSLLSALLLCFVLHLCVPALVFKHSEFCKKLLKDTDFKACIY